MRVIPSHKEPASEEPDTRADHGITCPHCSRSVPVNEEICHHCGADIVRAVTLTSSRTNATAVHMSKLRRRAMTYLGLALVIGLAGSIPLVAAAFFFHPTFKTSDARFIDSDLWWDFYPAAAFVLLCGAALFAVRKRRSALAIVFAVCAMLAATIVVFLVGAYGLLYGLAHIDCLNSCSPIPVPSGLVYSFLAFSVCVVLVGIAGLRARRALSRPSKDL
jgi:hypothetical protein